MSTILNLNEDSDWNRNVCDGEQTLLPKWNVLENLKNNGVSKILQSGKVVLQTEFRIEQRVHGHHFGIICLTGAQEQN